MTTPYWYGPEDADLQTLFTLQLKLHISSENNEYIIMSWPATTVTYIIEILNDERLGSEMD